MEDQKPNEEGDGLEAAEEGHGGLNLTSGFTTLPNSNFYHLLDFMFSNPYYPWASFLVGCLAFARDLLFPSNPGLSTWGSWVNWMNIIMHDPFLQFYYGCDHTISESGSDPN